MIDEAYARSPPSRTGPRPHSIHHPWTLRFPLAPRRTTSARQACIPDPCRLLHDEERPVEGTKSLQADRGAGNTNGKPSSAERLRDNQEEGEVMAQLLVSIAAGIIVREQLLCANCMYM